MVEKRQLLKKIDLFNTARPDCKRCAHVCKVHSLCICDLCSDIISDHSCQPVFTMQDIITHAPSAYYLRNHQAIADLVTVVMHQLFSAVPDEDFVEKIRIMYDSIMRNWFENFTSKGPFRYRCSWCALGLCCSCLRCVSGPPRVAEGRRKPIPSRKLCHFMLRNFSFGAAVFRAHNTHMIFTCS